MISDLLIFGGVEGDLAFVMVLCDAAKADTSVLRTALCNFRLYLTY